MLFRGHGFKNNSDDFRLIPNILRPGINPPLDPSLHKPIKSFTFPISKRKILRI